jgi:DNA processing protein
LSLEARAFWNALVEPGDRIAGALLHDYGAEQALELFRRKSLAPVSNISSQELSNAYERWSTRSRADLGKRALEHAGRQDMHPLLPSSPLWPKALNDLGNFAPLMLWYRGNSDNFQALSKSIGIVGSRVATHYGARITGQISQLAVSEGAAVVSGGALGIDAIAHRAALAVNGLTMAFMAGGLDSLYPSAHFELFEEIAHSGLLISELGPGVRPTRWRFLQRNRLIAASSEVIVVSEAGWRSGSINTVNHAIELGRPVFAVPGPIEQATSAGSNRLIRDGMAQMLIDVNDLPEELGWRKARQMTSTSMGQLELRLFDALGSRSKSALTLQREAGLDSKELAIALGGLKLLGLVEQGENLGWKRSLKR